MSRAPEIAPDPVRFTDTDFRRVRSLLSVHAGIALGNSKRTLIYQRLEPRVRAAGLTDFAQYLDYAEGEPSEFAACLHALTANLTGFFRDPRHFTILADYVRRRRFPRLRIWCAAAATGEEPYSIAMTLIEAYESDTPPVEIIASDIDADVLAQAQRGTYAQSRLNAVSARQRARFFQIGGGPNVGVARVLPTLRTMIDFRRIDLQSDAWTIPERIDVILCRNILSYFDEMQQRRIVERFAAMLPAEGRLFTGIAEKIGAASDLLVPLGKSVYRPLRLRGRSPRSGGASGAKTRSTDSGT